MLSETEVADIIARLKRVAAEGVSHNEIPALAGALKEAEVAQLIRLTTLGGESACSRSHRNVADESRDKVLLVEDVALQIGRSPKEVRRLAREGKLKGFRNGPRSRWQFRQSSVGLYLGALESSEVEKTLSKSYSSRDDRRRTPRRPKPTQKNARRAGGARRRPLEHNSEVRKGRDQDPGTVVPFDYSALKGTNKDTTGE